MNNPDNIEYIRAEMAAQELASQCAQMRAIRMWGRDIPNGSTYADAGIKQSLTAAAAALGYKLVKATGEVEVAKPNTDRAEELRRYHDDEDRLEGNGVRPLGGCA